MPDPQIQTFAVGGLDETNDDAFVPPTAMRVCQNVVFPDANTAQTRQGYTQIAMLQGCRRLFSRQKELLMTDGLYAYRYNGTTTPKQIAPVSPCVASRVLLSSGNYRTATRADFPTTAPLGSVAEDANTGLRIAVANDGVSIAATIYDLATGKVLRTDTLNATAGNKQGTLVNQPRVILNGSVAFVFYWDTTDASNLQYQSFNLATITGSWSSKVAILNGLGSTYFWDACLIPGANKIAVLVGDNGTPRVQLSTLNASGTTLSTGSSVTVDSPSGTTPITAVGVAATAADGIACAWGTVSHSGTVYTFNLRWAVYSSSLVAVTAATTLQTNTNDEGTLTPAPFQYVAIGLAKYPFGNTGTTAQWVLTFTRIQRFAITGGSWTGTVYRQAYSFWQLYCSTDTSGLFGAYGPLAGYMTLSKPIVMSLPTGTRVFALVKSEDSSANTAVNDGTGQSVMLLELDNTFAIGNNWIPPRVSALVAPLFGGNNDPCSMDCVSWTQGNGIVAVGAEEDEAGYTSLDVLTFNFDSPQLWQHVELGDWTYLSGGIPMVYDGKVLTEVGFFAPPLQPVVVYQDSTTSLISTNTAVQYIVVYAWQDANGNVHRSAPSNPTTALDVTRVGAGHGATQFQLLVFPCRLTYRQPYTQYASTSAGANPVRIEVYRNSPSDGNDQWHLVANVPNDPTATTGIVVSDFIADTAVINEPFLYTTGGFVESDPGPSLTALSVHSDRVMGIAEDGRTMFYSTAYTRGECPYFTDAFTIDWPEGPITATWSLEQRLHAATANDSWFLIGDGPSETGAGVDWTAPQSWQADVGVVDARGVGVFTGGAVLSTRRGLYLQGRDGSFSWLSQPRRTLASNPVVNSVAVLTTDGAIRITTKAQDAYYTGAVNSPTYVQGVTLHYDHRHGKWAQHVAPSGVGFDSTVVVDGVLYGLTYGTSGGVAWGLIVKEDATTNQDTINASTSWVAPVLTWGWVTAGVAMQGWGEVESAVLLGRYATPHTLTISQARDYNPTPDANPLVYADTAITTLATAHANVEQLRACTVNGTATCSAISYSVTTSAPTSGASVGTGAGVTLQALTVRSTPKRGEIQILDQGATQ